MDYFVQYLEHGPVFAAMLRGAECALLEQSAPFTTPVLDLGCGDGFFSSLLPHPEAYFGLDPDLHSLRRARKTGAYRAVASASATSLPFRDGAFGTVIANSVLEHIPDIDAATGEIARVLAPDGRLLITGPSHRFAALLGGTHYAERVGLEAAARTYGRWFNWHSRHFHTDDETTWRKRLSSAGLTVEHAHYYFPAPAMRAFDAAHYLSAPRLVSRKLTGRWVAVKALSLNPLYARLFRRHADPTPVADGGGLFLIARKEESVG